MATSSESAEPLPEYPSPELIECPYPYFERMRTEAPVHLAEDEYLVFRHEDVARVLRDRKHYSEDIGPTSFDRGTEKMISSRSGEDHRRTRDLAYRPITPGRLRAIEPHLVNLVDELVDGFLERGECDFMSEYALPIPGLLMCDLMGISRDGEDGRLILGHWGDLVATGDPAIGGKRYSLDDLLSFFERKLRERAENPGDDMLSLYVETQIARDGEVNFDYLTVLATEMLVGGAGTTALMMTNALWLLLTHPEQLERARADRSLIPWVLEESLRVESVVQERERVVVSDVELGGVQIPAGSKVRLVLGSANRDPDVFAEPDRFDPSRGPGERKQHYGFGRGVHTCLGAPLARLEGRIALERLIDRTANLRLADRNTYEHVYSTHFRSFRELWIQFDPA
jgi:cytochrome P450